MPVACSVIFDGTMKIVSLLPSEAMRKGRALDGSQYSAIANAAGLNVNRGIVVNEDLETSHPDVFAVGECTEFDGQLVGLAAPHWEQGQVLAATSTGKRGPVVTGDTPATKMKLQGG